VAGEMKKHPSAAWPLRDGESSARPICHRRHQHPSPRQALRDLRRHQTALSGEVHVLLVRNLRLEVHCCLFQLAGLLATERWGDRR
jgi:hypothetical protein